MRKDLHRIIIYNKDVQLIIGKGESSAHRLLTKIRLALGKPADGLITMDEFCAYTKINKEEVVKFLKD